MQKLTSNRLRNISLNVLRVKSSLYFLVAAQKLFALCAWADPQRLQMFSLVATATKDLPTSIDGQWDSLLERIIDLNWN